MVEREVALNSAEFEIAHKIAREWADVPVEHLVAVLNAMEPQLQREHQRNTKQDQHRHELEKQRLKEAERRHELELAKLREREARAADAHRQHLVGVAAGMVVSLSCIGGAIWVGITGHYWQMAILVGPVLLALTKMFVLRRSDTTDIQTAAGMLGKLFAKGPAPLE